MEKAEQFDALILGSGEAGKFMSWHLAKAGKRVATIERKYLGGACPNIACLPSKNVIHTAKVASYFRRNREFGMAGGEWKVDMPGVRERKRKMVDGLHQMHVSNFDRSGVEVVMGTGRFIGERMLEVTTAEGKVRLMQGERVFLDTGSRAKIDGTPGLAEAAPLTHVEALELDIVPEHLFILGGGYVGMEFAQAMRRLDSRVTVIERNERLAHREDPDVSEALHQLFYREGIEVLTDTHLTRVEGISGEHIQLFVRRGSAETLLEGSHMLVAVGRIPNTDGIGPELAGVKTTKLGHIQVNDRLETTAQNVWAMGDCAGSPYFTHISFDDFRIVRDNLAGGRRTTMGRQVPSCVFVDPELARVGLSESEAKHRNIPYRLAKIPIESVLRTHTLSETTGFLKALVGKDNDHILGFTGFGVASG
jgi:pyruvate/2-oxoglutarate dehydrogenase complex dihydrolipoamide dehydrogenase (E3) component